MPVQDLHPQYENKQYEFRQMRDTVAGTSSVKRSGSLYLPVPAAMYEASVHQPPTGYSCDDNDLKNGNIGLINNAPWNHSNPAYSSYVQRARFPDITALSLRGLTGIAIKKDIEIELPSQISYLEKNATRDGKTISELFAFSVQEVLTTGRISFLLEIDEVNSKFFINTYSAESFINWRSGASSLNKSNEIARLAVFQEKCCDDDADEFSHEDVDCHLVLRDVGIIEEEFASVYSIQKYIDGEQGDLITPLLRGNPFPFPPLVTANADSVGFSIGPCPLIGISDIAISIYQKDADMSNSEFLTCNPMLVTTGVQDRVDENGCAIPSTSFPIGSNVTMNLPDSDSNAFYVEPNSNCLNHMNNRIQALRDEAVQYGAAILTSDKKSSEAAETVKMRQAGNSSSLRTIIKNVADAIEQILQYAYMWETNTLEETDQIVVSPNLELVESALTPQELTALLNSYLNRAISHETFLKNFKNGGFKLSTDSVEEEKTLIENSVPNLVE